MKKPRKSCGNCVHGGHIERETRFAYREKERDNWNDFVRIFELLICKMFLRETNPSACCCGYRWDGSK